MADKVAADDYPTGRMLGSITGVAIASFVLAWSLGPSPVSAVALTGDLSDASFVEIRTLKGQVALSGELRSRVDRLGNIEKDAALLGKQGDQVIGEIEIEIPRMGASDPRQELEVDVISLQPFTTYQVVVNDRPAGTFTTDDRGSVDVELLSVPPRSR